ncbi:MAG: hypothetical protein V3V62_14320, partial [bacterium]
RAFGATRLNVGARTGVFAAARGGFFPKPSLAFLAEAGAPEIAIAPNAPESVDLLKKAVEPIIEKALARGGAGETHLHVTINGSPFVDRRTMDEFFRRLKEFEAGRRTFRIDRP